MILLFTIFACTAGKSTGDLSGDAWADNWFALYADESLVIEDSVSITTERSFNAESFSYSATAPYQLALILKDYKETDSGLEYIGESNQQMGDGGFILQIFDGADAVVVSDTSWRCLVIHTAPLNTDCEDDPNPDETCEFESLDEPDGWMAADYDDSAWDSATAYTSAEVSPKEGYDDIDWDASAELIWGPSLTQDNTILCRLTVE